jgi:hypothetical protein
MLRNILKGPLARRLFASDARAVEVLKKYT